MVMKFQALKPPKTPGLQTTPWKLQLSMREDGLMENMALLAQNSIWGRCHAAVQEHTPRRSSLPVNLQNLTYGKGKGKSKPKSNTALVPNWCYAISIISTSMQ